MTALAKRPTVSSVVLYKYADASGAFKILDNLTLKVTPPNELNDPFELTPRSVKQLTRQYLHEKAITEPEHFRPAYEDWMANEGKAVPFADFLKAILTLPPIHYLRLLKMYRESLAEFDLRAIHEASAHLVVLCLSARNDYIPMWSHYADHHKGVVLAVDAAAECFNLGSPLTKVRYRKGRVRVDPRSLATQDAVFAKTSQIIMTKSRDWEDEKEYRFWYPKTRATRLCGEGAQAMYVIQIWPSAIRALILGCCISSENERKIADLLTLRRFSHVQLLRARRHAHHFRLDVVPA